MHPHQTHGDGLAPADRRRFPRVHGPFDGSWDGESGRRPGRIWDVSAGGCYVDAMNQQHPGQRVTVTLHFPEGTVTAVSEVVYSLANQGFGLRFVSILPDSASVLDAALERLGGPGR